MVPVPVLRIKRTKVEAGWGKLLLDVYVPVPPITAAPLHNQIKKLDTRLYNDY